NTGLSGQITVDAAWRPRLYLVQPVYYKQLISAYEGTVVDSADLAPDGSFAFGDLSRVREKGIYLLVVQPRDSRFPTALVDSLPAENYICLVLSPGSHTRLRGEARALARSYQLLEGHEESRLLAQLRDLRAPLYREAEATDQDSEPTHSEDLPERSVAQQTVDRALESFLDTTRAVWPAFAALRLRAPQNEFRDRPEFFLRVRDRLRQLAPGHAWVDQLDFFLQPSRLPLLAGEKLPDFALPTTKGDTLRLSQLRADLLLVDFWASWCAPCRRANRETIRPLYERYHERGFEVLGVSIDRSRAAWLAGIEKDSASWPQVSDLLGDASPVRQSLRFEFIPNNYLLDREGRLLARNLHGEELRIFVENHFAR
ncbi:MAG: TlpA family protein disulfide reductase, partial [Saprospiraceae bacterium]|nr:TlpA family protein disulfide reductase [Saprospiraceae bacterium]